MELFLLDMLSIWCHNRQYHKEEIECDKRYGNIKDNLHAKFKSHPDSYGLTINTHYNNTNIPIIILLSILSNVHPYIISPPPSINCISLHASYLLTNIYMYTQTREYPLHFFHASINCNSIVPSISACTYRQIYILSVPSNYMSAAIKNDKQINK